MNPARAEIVKAFQLQLGVASFCGGPINDSELESWLFLPGLDRIQLLHWCLGQLDASLRDRFQNCDDEETKRRTIDHVKSFGLSHNEEVILGSADEGQCKFWKRMLALLKTAEHLKQPTQSSKTYPTNTTVSSLARSKDLRDLLHTSVALIPSDMHLNVSAILKRNVDEELQAAAEQLEDLHEKITNISSEDDFDDVDRSVHSCDEYREAFTENFNKVQESYKHLVLTVFPAVQRQPDNPVADILGSYIENLADNVISFVQMLKSTEDIYKMATILQTSDQIGSSKSLEPSELQQSISKCHSLVTEILSLWRLHKLV